MWTNTMVNAQHESNFISFLLLLQENFLISSKKSQISWMLKQSVFNIIIALLNS